MTAPTTERKSSVFTEESTKHSAERETGLEVSSLHPERTTFRNGLRGAGDWLRDWAVPPNLLTEPPPAVAEMSAYACRGTWTASTDGLVRRLGVLWMLLVAIPVSTVCRYIEWGFARPSRAVVIFLTWQLIARSDGPGPWLAAHIIRPFWSGLGWIFLP